VAERLPNLGFGVQYVREGRGDQVVSAIVSLPLPLGKPWRFEAARLEADHAAIQAMASRTKRQLLNELTLTEHELSHTREFHEHLQQNTLPPLREALRVEMSRYSAGATDLSRVIWLRQRLLAAEEQLVKARADASRARIRWLSSTGKLSAEVLP
jgi:outer membrane protein TolC